MLEASHFRQQQFRRFRARDNFFIIFRSRRNSQADRPIIGFESLKSAGNRQPFSKRIPAIIPLVLYHGNGRWNATTRFTDLVDLGSQDKQELAAFIPDFGFFLDDLSGQSDQQLRARAITQLGLLTLLSLQRLPNASDPAAVLERMADLMTAVIAAPSGVQALTAILCYLTEVSDPEPQSIIAVLESKVGAQAVEAFMTYAERLIQQGEAKGEAKGVAKGEAKGVAKGRAEGEAKGRAEGETKGRAEMLRKLVTLKFGPLSAEMEKSISSATIADLDLWAERVLSAQRPEDIFV